MILRYVVSDLHVKLDEAVHGDCDSDRFNNQDLFIAELVTDENTKQ